MPQVHGGGSATTMLAASVQELAASSLKYGVCWAASGTLKGLIRNLDADRGGGSYARTHSMNISEFMLSHVQAPSAPRACRPRGRSSAARP